MSIYLIGTCPGTNFPGQFVWLISNIIAVADGGPDWPVKEILNLMSLGLFWLCSELDLVVTQSYAPGHSRFNPMERNWTQLTKWLVGVTFPVRFKWCCVPRDDIGESWNVVLDCAEETCTKFWNGKWITVNRVTAKTFLASNPLVAARRSEDPEDPKLQEL